MDKSAKDIADSEKLDHQLLSEPVVHYTGVPFEEFLYYAALQRQAETAGDQHDGPPRQKSNWLTRLSDHKGTNVNIEVQHSIEELSLSPEETERVNASRALRVASWASVFYLITTDILGPFNAPFAISQVGWVPGILLYFFMGVVALYTGLILWRLFIRLDSLKYPLKTYADIAERIFGRTARHVCTVLQSLQLLINVATICLSNGQALAQISKGRLCFSICILIWALLGMIIGQIRTLKTYGWLANGAVWINLSIIFISMGFIAHSPPNFAAAEKSLGVPPGPVITETFTHLPLFLQVNGIMNMVFAYGGAMIFPEMMAEMRRPMDFWKGMTLAQALIFSAYLLYGVYVYAFQGQFTLPLAFQGVSKFSWQTVGEWYIHSYTVLRLGTDIGLLSGNVLALVTGIIAAGLYGNIGIKVVYINLVEDWLHGPGLMTQRGRMCWSAMVILYWALAFVVGSAIPQVQTITGLIAAIAIMQFSYSFPFFLRLGYDVVTDAMSEDQPFLPGRRVNVRVDTWYQWSRWKRGLFSGRWYFKLFNLILGLGGIAMACLGMWGAGESIREVFRNTKAATSFGCRAPV